MGLALLMGMSALGNAPFALAADADADGGRGKAKTMEAGKASDTREASGKEKAAETGKIRAIAEDITKDIPDKDFAAETSLDGIQYDRDRETVTPAGIVGEDGKAYWPGQPGTYTASYLVVPKDKGDTYVITRKITLTDTKGQAHSGDNGGNRQKKDTASEDSPKADGEPKADTGIKPEVRIVGGNGRGAKEAAKRLEEEIQSGSVLLLSGADNPYTGRTTVTLEQGDPIPYPSYIGNYSTCWFHVNGKIAYCLESQKATPPSGDYVAEVLESNKNLQKVLYYGYGGAGDITDSLLSGKSPEEKYVYTHIAASYAYAGEAGFTGCEYDDLVSAGVIGYIDRLFGMEEPPKGELKLSQTKVKAARDGSLQKTPDILLSGDHRNFVTLSVPQNVTCHNRTKGTSVTDGQIRIYGGDTFYLTANLLLTGGYSSGSLHGSVGETWRTLVLSTGEAGQDIGVFESEPAEPVSFHADWLGMTRIELMKKDAHTKNPLSGAVYGIYTDPKCKDLLMEMPATGSDGKAVSDYFEASIKTVYVKEIKAPDLYAKNPEVYTVTPEAGKTVEVSAADEWVTGAVHIQKADRETESFLPQGDSALSGAVYGLYAGEDIHHPDQKTGIVHKKDSLIVQGSIQADGTLDFPGLYLGNMYVKEITPPKGYTLDTTEYDVNVGYEGQDRAEVSRNLTVSEQVKKQAFQLIKISEDGSQTETDQVAGAGFKVYLVSSLSKVKSGELRPSNGTAFTAEDFRGYDFSGESVAVTYEGGKAVPVPELVTDSKGYAASPELAYGLYVVEESTVPENLKVIDPFLVNVDEDSREPMQWRIFDDRPFEFLLKIIKKDAQTGNIVLKAGASYQIYDYGKEAYIEQTVHYPKKEKIKVFSTNGEGYLITPEELKAGTYRIEEVRAPEGFVRQGKEMALHDGKNLISPLQLSKGGTYRENPQKPITITVSSHTAHQIDPDTGAVVVEVEQRNDEQVGSLTLEKTGEQLKAVTGDSLMDKGKRLLGRIKAAVTGDKEQTGISHAFQYEESGVEGAVFELYAKEDIRSPDGAKDGEGRPVIRYAKDELVATLTTDAKGKAHLNNLPLGSYYMKETTAGEHFVLNTERKEFTLTAGNDTQAVVYEGIAYKNERQKIAVSLEKTDAVSGRKLEGVIFGLYAAQDIVSKQGEVLVKKDTLLEKKATDKDGRLTFDSDLFHGKYDVKEELGKPGYLPNQEIWEFDTSYGDQNKGTIAFSKEIKNQPTESRFTKKDAATGKELEGAKLQIIDEDGNVAEEWTSTREPHVVYALPEGTYILHEEHAPHEEGYVSANDILFEVSEDGSVTKVEMEDEHSRTEISKTDTATGKGLKGASLQILNKEGKALEEWVSDGSPHAVEKLPVGEELTLRETKAPKGYELAEDVKFTLKDTKEVQRVEMQDAKTPETPGPKTGDSQWKPWLPAAICGLSAAMIAAVLIRRRKQKKVVETDGADEKTEG